MKLINKYAESYNLLKDEYKSLDNEVKDLRLNLKLNKEIISDILNLNSSINETKFKNIILKLNNELNTLYSQLEKISKEKFNLRNKILKQKELNEDNIKDNENNSNEINKNIIEPLTKAEIKSKEKLENDCLLF